MQRIQKTIYAAIVASEASHIFCCVLPTVFSIVSLLAGAGMMVMPASWVTLHDRLHDWEIPMIMISGVMIALGWGLHAYSKKIDCHDTGCTHGTCAPKKDRTRMVLKIATLLFVINLVIYGVFHRGLDVHPEHTAATAVHEQHDHDHGHDH